MLTQKSAKNAASRTGALVRRFWRASNKTDIAAISRAVLTTFGEEAYDPRRYKVSNEDESSGPLLIRERPKTEEDDSFRRQEEWDFIHTSWEYQLKSILKALFFPRFMREGKDDYALIPSNYYQFIEDGDAAHALKALYDDALALRKLLNPAKWVEFVFSFAYFILEHISVWFLSEREEESGFLQFIATDTNGERTVSSICSIRTAFNLGIRLPLRLCATVAGLVYEGVLMITSPVNHTYRPIVQFFQRIVAQPGEDIDDQFVGIFGFHNPFARYFGGISFLVVMLSVLTIASFITASVLTGGILPGVAFLGWLSATIASIIPIISAALPTIPILSAALLAKIGIILLSFTFLPGIVHRVIEEFPSAIKDFGNIFGEEPGFDKAEEMLNTIPSYEHLYRGYELKKGYEMFGVDPFSWMPKPPNVNNYTTDDEDDDDDIIDEKQGQTAEEKGTSSPLLKEPPHTPNIDLSKSSSCSSSASSSITTITSIPVDVSTLANSLSMTFGTLPTPSTPSRSSVSSDSNSTSLTDDPTNKQLSSNLSDDSHHSSSSEDPGVGKEVSPSQQVLGDGGGGVVVAFSSSN